MDLLVFMLTPRSMMNVEYDQWGLGIPFTNRVTNELDYDKFSGTRLMPPPPPSLLQYVFLLFSFFFN